MNFFGGKKSDNKQVTELMSVEELEQLISEKKDEISDLSAAISQTEKQIEKTYE